MKFVSKNSNLMVVLRPGLPGNHLSGTAAVNGIYIKFQGGMVDVKDEKFIDMMKLHPAFGIDYVAVEEVEPDPFAYLRKETEPTHIIQEMKYGHLENVAKTKKTTPLSPEIRKLLQAEAISMAKEMAKEMLPGMVKEVIEGMKGDTKETNAIIEDTKEKTAPAKGKVKTSGKVDAPTTKS